MKVKDFMPDDGDPSVEHILNNTKTLSGDIRDMVLTHIRTMVVPWALLNEEEQQIKLNAAERLGEDVVRQTLRLITEAGFPSLNVSIEKYGNSKTLQINLIAADMIENVIKLAEHGKGPAVLVLASPEVFFGERAPVKADKDQKPLPFSQGED